MNLMSVARAPERTPLATSTSLEIAPQTESLRCLRSHWSEDDLGVHVTDDAAGGGTGSGMAFSS
jgi:hypothetical protein